MSQSFDPYHKWLGIPPEEQPPDHYRLLGVRRFEDDAEVIEAAADQRMAHLKVRATGQYGPLSQRLLNEVAAAKVCLLNADRRTAYDQQLQKEPPGKPSRATPPGMTQSPEAGGSGTFRGMTVPAGSPEPPPVAAGLSSDQRIAVLGPIIAVGAFIAVVLLGVVLWLVTTRGRPVAGVGPDAVDHKTKAGDSPSGEKPPASPEPKKSPVVSPTPPSATSPPRQPPPSRPLVPAPQPPVSPSPPVTPAQPTVGPTATGGKLPADPGHDPAPVPPGPEQPKPRNPSPEAPDQPPAVPEQPRVTPDQPPATPEQPAAMPDQPPAQPEAFETPQPPVAQTPPKPQRSAVPDADAEKKSLAIVQDLYGTEYRRASSAKQKMALVDKLLQQASQTVNDPPGEYVLLRLARDIAIQAGDVAAALRIVEQMEALFEINVLDAKVEVITKAAKLTNLGSTQNKALVDQMLGVAEELALGDQFRAAEDMGSMAMERARKARDGLLMKRVVARNKDVRDREAAYNEAQAALALLKTKPDDAAANLTAGKFLCLVKGDWDRGLPLLAAAGDKTWSGPAQLELKKPPASAEQITVGDVWWELAAGQPKVEREALLVHAGDWYEQARANVPSGLMRTKLDNRLGQIAQIPHAGRPRPAPRAPMAPDGKQ